MKTPEYLKESNGEVLVPKKVDLTELRSRKAIILDILKKHHKLTPGEISTKSGNVPSMTTKNLKELMSLGLVERVPITYSITQKALDLHKDLHDWPPEVLQGMTHGSAKAANNLNLTKKIKPTLSVDAIVRKAISNM